MRASALIATGYLALAMCGTGTPAPAMPLIRLADAEMPAAHEAQVSENTAAFVRDAALDDLYEAAAARLATHNARSSAVKDFAQTLIRDRDADGDPLRATIWQANMDVALPTVLDEEHAARLRNLSAAAPQDFDRRYITQEIETQDDAARLATNYADNGDNAKLRAFARETIPKIADRLTAARHLAVGLGGMTASR